jgi:Flp pilus assembly protein TadG
MRAPHKKQAGQVLVMVALSAVVLIGSVGLALDSALGYLVKAKLNAAVDAASLAAARGVSTGDSRDAQEANARLAARKFFNINYPDKFLLSTPTLDPVGVQFDGGTVTIDVAARASLPVSLMGVLGFKTLEVSARAQTVRKDLDMVLVMDTSGSLVHNAEAVKAAGIAFLDKFNASVDRVGLLHFSSGVQIDVPIRTVDRGFDRFAASAAVGQYHFDGGTNSAEGMWHARNQLRKIDASRRSSLRVIVFFSDGSPAAFSSHFFPADSGNCRKAGSIATWTDLPQGWATGVDGLYRIDAAGNNKLSPFEDCKASAVTRLPDWYNASHDGDTAGEAGLHEFPIVTNAPRVVTSSLSTPQRGWTNVHRASRNLVEAMAAKARQEDIFVFTLGMGSSLTKPEGPDKEKGEDLLRCLANAADAKASCRKPTEPVGLYCYAATESELSPCFTRLASAILRISK